MSLHGVDVVVLICNVFYSVPQKHNSNGHRIKHRHNFQKCSDALQQPEQISPTPVEDADLQNLHVF